MLARLDELRRAEADYMAQLHAVQGAIAEITEYWLPFLAKAEEVQGQSALEPIETDDATE